MRSAWASGLHLRSRTDEKREAGDEVNTFDKAHSSTTDTNALGMLLPAFAGRKPSAGTTLGMMLADVPVVLLGEAAAKALPLKWVHRAAAGAFIVLAVLALFGVRL